MHLVVRHVLDVKNTDVINFQQKQRVIALFRLGGDVQLDRGLELVVGLALLGVQIDLNLHIGLHIGGGPFLRHDVLKRHITDKLPQNAHLWRCGRCCLFVCHGRLPVKNS